ncbi:hypothetical protein CN378_04665 [Bacillus sp. AFS015802]|nr:hypothetical protein CN378_04665 [Bacillus sp. AFS015802]
MAGMDGQLDIWKFRVHFHDDRGEMSGSKGRKGSDGDFPSSSFFYRLRPFFPFLQYLKSLPGKRKKPLTQIRQHHLFPEPDKEVPPDIFL